MKKQKSRKRGSCEDTETEKIRVLPGLVEELQGLDVKSRGARKTTKRSRCVSELAAVAGPQKTE